MSLMRLLSAGRSLVGAKDQVSRYRMGSPGLLPKFGSKKNPFSAEKKFGLGKDAEDQRSAEQPSASEMPNRTVAAVSKGASKSQPDKKETVFARARVMLSALGRYAREKVQPVPVVRPVENASQSCRPAVPANRTGWVEKMKRMTFQRLAASARKTRLRSRKAPVQGELSLDKIKVVRNDLSDTDFEVVTGGKARSSSATGRIERVTKTEAAENRDAAHPAQGFGHEEKNQFQAASKDKSASPSELGARDAMPKFKEARDDSREMESGMAAIAVGHRGAAWFAAVKR